MSALLSVIAGMRVAETTGTHSMNFSTSSASPKIALAISRPIATSKPSHLPVVGTFTLKGVLSSCVPMRILPLV
jgi:hypothetical protein